VTEQDRKTYFRSPEKEARVNAIVCHIWVETSEEGAERRTSQTGYPYGVPGTQGRGGGRDFGFPEKEARVNACQCRC
jgi:hypothetical protein